MRNCAMLCNTSQRLAKVQQCHPNPLDQQEVPLGSIGGMGIGKVPSTIITMHACHVAFPTRYLID